MHNQNFGLNIGDEIGFVTLAQNPNEADKVIFFPVAEITTRDGMRAYRYMYPDGELSSAAITESRLRSHVIRIRRARIVQITPAPETGMLCLTNRREEFIEAMERGTDSDLEVYPDWERDAFVVVNHDNGKEYKVNLRTADGNLYSDCECGDFQFRRRLCKHQSAVLTNRERSPLSFRLGMNRTHQQSRFQAIVASLPNDKIWEIREIINLC